MFEHHVEDLPPSERVELYYGMGAAELKLGEKDKAKEHLQQALELDPTHRPSLLASMEFGEAKPESLIDAKKALLATADRRTSRPGCYGEIGDVWLEKLDNRDEAVSAWREGLELKPDDHKLLHKCLDVYVEEKAWPQALEMLERLIEFEKVPSVRAKYRHAAGLICRDELGRPSEAAAHLSAALDDDPTLERSSEALEELLKDRQEWKELARFYRKHSSASARSRPATPTARTASGCACGSALGEVCLDELGERESALAALEVALTLDRGNLERHKQLADLYVQAGPIDVRQVDRRAPAHPARREEPRALVSRAQAPVHPDRRSATKSVQLSVALCFLKKGEPDDLTKANTFKHQPMADRAARAVGRDVGAAAAPRGGSLPRRAASRILAPMLAASTAQQHKALGLNRKEALSIEDQHSYGKALKYVTTTLNVAPPETYVRAEQKDAVQFANCIDGRTLVPVFSLGAPLVGEKRRQRRAAVRAGAALRAPAAGAVHPLHPAAADAARAHHRRGDGAGGDAGGQGADGRNGQDGDGDAAGAAAAAGGERRGHRAQAARRRRPSRKRRR